MANTEKDKTANAGNKSSHSNQADRKDKTDKSLPHPDNPSQPLYMQNRELSWLDFNKRVLDQGDDDTVAPLERLNFISIFWSNLKEFFMIRVGSLTDLQLVKKLIIDKKSGMTPTEQLDAIYARCHELYPYYERTYKKLNELLADEGVVHVQMDELDDKSRIYLDKYVRDNIMPVLSPQIINARHPFPHLENGRLYIVVRLNDKISKTEKAARREQRAEKAAQNAGIDPNDISADNSENHTDNHEESGTDSKTTGVEKTSKNLGAEGVTLGLIPLPGQCERIVRLPGKRFRFVLLEHAIEMYAAEIFSMYKVKHTNIICVTRNADLDATEGTDEQGEDYREHMKRILKKRARLAPVRIETQRPLSPTVKPLLLERLNLKEHQVFVSSVPLDMSYTFDLAGFLSQKKRDELTQAPFTPSWPASLERDRSIIEQVSRHEVLLSYPYESMDPFVQLLREAANDPQVLSIKITLYRLANQSHVAEALIAAAEAGKEVTALFELRARFDESNNIEWSQRFEQAGCHVIYGFRDFKVHSKICAITRQTKDGLQYITQLGTGNYNEKTARLYTDFSFITTDTSIGHDAIQFFHNMALENTSDNYDILWVAPLQIKQNIIAGIDGQIARALIGLPSGLFFKTNSVTDLDIMNKIVEASQAGVPCTLFVRGISCLVPGIEGYTDNVRVVSIVGRLLEHSRIFCFGPREACKIYLSSADVMTRNMDKRIEIAWPVLGEQLHDKVVDYITTCMSDTAKLRELLPDRSYTPLRYFATKKGRAHRKPLKPFDANPDLSAYLGGVDYAGSNKPVLFDAQNALINDAQRRHSIVAELRAARNANRSAYTSYFGQDETNSLTAAPEQPSREAEQNVFAQANQEDNVADTTLRESEIAAAAAATAAAELSRAEAAEAALGYEQQHSDALATTDKPSTPTEIVEVPRTAIELIPLTNRRRSPLQQIGLIAGNIAANAAQTIIPAAQNAARVAAPVARDMARIAAPVAITAVREAGRLALFAAKSAGDIAANVTRMIASGAQGNTDRTNKNSGNTTANNRYKNER